MAERETDIAESRSRAELFEALSHDTRIKILKTLEQEPTTFAGLKKALGIESSGNLQHHLGKLGDLVKQTDDGMYTLTDDAREALRTLKAMQDFDRASRRSSKEGGGNWWWWHRLENPKLFPLAIAKAMLVILLGVVVYVYQPTFQMLLLLGSLWSLGLAIAFASLLSKVSTGRRFIVSMALFLLSSWLFLYVCTMYFSTIAISGMWNIVMTLAFWLPVYLFMAHSFLGAYERKL